MLVRGWREVVLMSQLVSRAERVGGSFRDPAAFMFTRDGVLYRQVNESGRDGLRRIDGIRAVRRAHRVG